MNTIRLAKKLTVKEAQSILTSKGFTIKWTGDDYRLCPKNGNESVAYYTDDLEDAVWTAKNWNGESTGQHMMMDF